MPTAFSCLPKAPPSGDSCGSSLLPILSPSVVPILQYPAPPPFPSLPSLHRSVQPVAPRALPKAAVLELLRGPGTGSNPCLPGVVGSSSSVHEAPVSHFRKWQLLPGQHFWAAKEDAERKMWGCSLKHCVRNRGARYADNGEGDPPCLPSIAAAPVWTQPCPRVFSPRKCN